jgi:hypothetical protein
MLGFDGMGVNGGVDVGTGVGVEGAPSSSMHPVNSTSDMMAAKVIKQIAVLRLIFFHLPKDAFTSL